MYGGTSGSKGNNLSPIKSQENLQTGNVRIT